MNQRRNSSGLRWNQTLFWNRHTVADPQWANATSILPITFSYNCSCKIEITVPCVIWPQQVRALSFVNQSKQYRFDFIDDFCVAASIGRPEQGASHVDVRPHLNSFIQLYTANVSADVLWTLSNSTLISFGVKPFICTYFHMLVTTFVFFHFAKNTKVVRFNHL